MWSVQRPLTGVAITSRGTSFSRTARCGVCGQSRNVLLHPPLNIIKYSNIMKFFTHLIGCSYSSPVGRRRRPPEVRWPATETDSGRSALRLLTSVWQFLRNRYRSTAPLICRLTGKEKRELLEAPIASLFSQINVQVDARFGERNSPTVSMVSLSSMSSCARGMSMCMRRVCCCLFMVSDGLVFLLWKKKDCE